jgi:predicted GNAT family acetyltransferase
MKIEHDRKNERFVANLDGGEAVLEYRKGPGGALDLHHTEVPLAERSQGIGNALVKYAMEYARKQDVKIVPTCPFVRSWLDAHPEYEDLAVAA